MGSKHAKTFGMALWSHLGASTAHFELEQKWKIVSLRMGSKLAKTFRMALSSHLVHHSSFWAQNLLKRSEWLSQPIWYITALFELEKNKKLFRSEWDQNMLKRSERLSQAIWCITAHSELDKKWKIVWLQMGSKLAKRSECLSQAIWCITAQSWAWKMCFTPNGLKTW